MVTITKTEKTTFKWPCWIHYKPTISRANRSMSTVNELTQINGQISECDQVPLSASLNKCTLAEIHGVIMWDTNRLNA